MEPIKTILTNSVYTSEGCEDLPAVRGEMQTEVGPIPIVETTWQLSKEEIEEVAKTGLIRARFIGTTIIPLRVSTQSAFAEFEQHLKDNPEFLEAYRNHFGITDNIEKE